MPDSPIDEVLEALRAALLARRAEAAERVARIKSGADAYLRAVEQDIAAQFAARNGLEAPHAGQTVRAALDLRAAVDALPEVRVRPAAPTPTNYSIPPGRPSLPPSSDVPIGPVAEEFVREVRGANLDEMATELFRVHVEEYAARARHLQEVLADRPADVDAIGRVIRTLTAMVSKRGLTGIYGLSRSHSGDWQARADEAARKRQRLLSIPPNPPPRISSRADDGLGETERDSGRPGAGGNGAAIEGGDDDPDDGPAGPAPAFVHLRASSASAPLVIVGGVAKPDKLERLRRRFDIAVEWVPVEAGSTQPVASLERRVREGRLAGLVLLQDLMAHKHFEPLVSAAQKGGVPWAYGDKAGKASLERALGEIDAMLAQRS